jgi:DNA invertase Pin-like site-specific DNA recombinase
MGEKFGYARVSTVAQRPDSQVEALIADGVHPDNIAVEYASGRSERPKLAAVVRSMDAGDVLVVRRLDRVGRCLSDLIELLEYFDAHEMTLRSLTEGVDTAGVAGKLLAHLLGALAEWEREAMSDAIRAGIAAAKARGQRFGRKPVLGPVEKRSALAYAEQGLGNTEIARLLNCSTTTIQRALAEMRGKPVPW